MITECIAWGVIALTFANFLVIIEIVRALRSLNKKMDVLKILDRLESIEKEVNTCRAHCKDIQKQLAPLNIVTLNGGSEWKSKD